MGLSLFDVHMRAIRLHEFGPAENLVPEDLPDLTPDSGEEWIAAADEHDLDKVFLVAPSSTDERIAMTTAACRGFVYATAVMGVTGARTSTSDLAGPLVERAKRLQPAGADLPVGVGGGRRARRGSHRATGGGHTSPVALGVAASGQPDHHRERDDGQ